MICQPITHASTASDHYDSHRPVLSHFPIVLQNEKAKTRQIAHKDVADGTNQPIHEVIAVREPGVAAIGRDQWFRDAVAPQLIRDRYPTEGCSDLITFLGRHRLIP
jgi:hypothetical protein